MRAGVNSAGRIVSIAALGIAAGALASLAAIGFVELVAVLNEWLLITPRSRFMMEDKRLLLIATVCVPAAGGLVVGLIHNSIPERRSHGPPDIIQSVQEMDGRIPVRTGFLSAVASVVSLGAGASVGQYGPLAHVGATLGSLVARVNRESRWMATVGVGCGVAAAISTAFNAPIAGIVFAHEVILRHYSLRAFAPITVAATMGHVMANVVFERPPLFRLDAISVNFAPEFLGFILIGAVGAFVAVFYMRAILFANRIARKIPCANALKPMLAGAGLGLAAIWLPDILGIGKETLRFAVIDHAFAPEELAFLLVAKILATALCIGFGFAGGVFSPALLIGILFGALAGNGAELILGDLRSDIGIYAICGMVAVTSAVIGAPLTTILIVFELTRNYDLATAAMVSVVFSNLVSYRAFGRSLFDVQLHMRGFDLTAGREKVMLDRRLIENYITRDHTELAPDASLDEAMSRLLEARSHEGYVVDADGVYLGTVKLDDLMTTKERNETGTGVTVACLAKPEALILTAGTTVWAAMAQMGDFVGESIPVLDDDGHGRMLGVVYEASIVKAYLDTMNDIRREENAGA
ncbi:MAG: chloride channel protein [Paracoccaceae bacterium]|nr:chloride channel protein [Paracoccaceae bacterium]